MVRPWSYLGSWETEVALTPEESDELRVKIENFHRNMPGDIYLVNAQVVVMVPNAEVGEVGIPMEYRGGQL